MNVTLISQDGKELGTFNLYREPQIGDRIEFLDGKEWIIKQFLKFKQYKYRAAGDYLDTESFQRHYLAIPAKPSRIEPKYTGRLDLAHSSFDELISDFEEQAVNRTNCQDSDDWNRRDANLKILRTLILDRFNIQHPVA